jgi:hypothetical protein
MNYYTKNVEQSYLQAHDLLCTRQAQEAALTLADLTKIAHKRHGNNEPGDQWISMTLRDLVALLTGERPDDA